jgi:hypothetical protein
MGFWNPRAGFRPAGRSGAVVGLILLAFVSGACSSSVATSNPTTTPTGTPVPATAAASNVAQSSVLNATGVPTTLDPCQLVTQQEASQLAGTTYGAGVKSTTQGNGNICTYGGQTTNVFEVIVGQAPDVATAQAGKAEAEQMIASAAGKGVTFTELPTLADGAAYYVGAVSISGVSINASAIYVLKGTVFFGFSDEALAPTPTLAAMETQVNTILGRLP